MAAKWYRREAVQAAIVGGVFILLAAVIAGLFSLPPKPTSDSRELHVTVNSEGVNVNVNNYLESLPPLGKLLETSGAYKASKLVGLKLNKDDPLHIDFILDKGDARLYGQELQGEARKLIQYFLTALTIPENHLWVNLSPYEANNIIPEDFASTQMGRHFLELDYFLKQLTASLTYPETELGRLYWRTIYDRTQAEFGTDQIEVNSYNKVWIVPDTASVVLTEGTALVTSGHLNVLTDNDYLASAVTGVQNEGQIGLEHDSRARRLAEISSEATKEILIPKLEEEINHGETFARIRQAYYSLILATWYKQTLRDSLLSKAIADQGKLAGLTEPKSNYVDKLYERYIESFNLGVYNYIREDQNREANEIIPRKYYSGGITIKNLGRTIADRSNRVKLQMRNLGLAAILVHVVLVPSGGEAFVNTGPTIPSEHNVVAVEEYSGDPGGIDFGRPFQIDQLGEEEFLFDRHALAKAPEIDGLHPVIMGMIAFPDIKTLIRDNSH